MKNKFKLVRYFFYGCFFLPIFGFFFLLLVGPYLGLASTEFEKLTGAEAIKQLGESSWPDNVHKKDVKAVSFKSHNSMDTSSYWYRIELSPEAAKKWSDFIHHEFQTKAVEKEKSHFWKTQGLHRQVSGRMPSRLKIGTAPNWWTPPEMYFETSELMGWYQNYESGVGKVVYSSYDEATKILWVFENSAQHDILWKHDSMPNGDVFLGIEEK